MVQNYSSCKNLIMQSTNYLQDISWYPQNNNLESSFQKKVLEQIPRTTTQFQFNHLYSNFLRESHMNKLQNFLTNTKSYVSFNQDFGKITQPKISVLTLVYYWEWFSWTFKMHLILYIITFHRVRLNRSKFLIHHNVLSFYKWVLCYHGPFHNKKR